MGDMTDAEAFRVPEELEDIVGRLSLVSTAGFAEWNPQREAILDLLDLVHRPVSSLQYWPSVSVALAAWDEGLGTAWLLR